MTHKRAARTLQSPVTIILRDERTMRAEDEALHHKLDAILEALHQLTAQETQQMKTFEQFKAELDARADAQEANVAEQTTIEQSIEAILQSNQVTLAALRQELADARLAGSGIDDATADAILAKFDAQIAKDQALTARMKAAAVANTEVANG